ncbi:MAG: NADH-quinone oxidoreductase subunit I [Gracilimonas sp.]
MVNVFKDGWLTFKSIFIGMGVTFRHLFSPSVTELYPEQKVELPEGARAQLFVNIDDCIGCNLCARACPVNCIDIETVQATSDVDLGKTSTGNPKRFWLTRFNIDMAKCMYCDLCVQPCPTDCIYMVPEYEYSDYDRSNLIFHFSDLTPDKVAEVKEKAEKEAEEKQRQKEEMMRKKEEEKRRKEQEEKKAPSADKSEENTKDEGSEKDSTDTNEGDA